MEWIGGTSSMDYCRDVFYNEIIQQDPEKQDLDVWHCPV